MNINKLIGNIIKVRRKELKIKQSEIALLFNITQSNISRMETGEISITVENLWLIEDALKLKASDIVKQCLELLETKNTDSSIEKTNLTEKC